MRKVVYIISDIDKALAFEWIAETLNGAAIQVTFILIIKQPAQLEQILKEKNVPVYSFYYQSKKDFPAILYKLYKTLKKIKADVVHCHLLYGALLGLTAAKLVNIKNRIYTRHHSDFHHRYFPGGIKWDKLCNALATKIIAPSNSVKQVLKNLEKVPEKKIVLIHHGFDLDYFRNVSIERTANLRNKYKIADSSTVIGVISRFTELKGIQYIIPAFDKLLRQHPDALLLLFNASGDYTSQIKECLKILPENKYHLISFEGDLAAVYQLFTIFIQASTDTLIEAFGQTYVEALAAGIPSVFTMSGIAPDFIIDGKNALTVPFKNSDAIYVAINKILTDKSLAKKLSEQGWESVKKKFALQIMTDKLKKLYDAG